MESEPANGLTGERTSRLYYHDATLIEFGAEVQAVERSATGAHLRIRLNQTAFYPTSGGQPHDTGTLNGVPVIDVMEDDDGEIWHLLAQPLAPEIRHVHGRIDWARRFDHMQQHTGQHLLSAAFDDALGVPTVGFHLGADASTIDLEMGSREALEWEQIFEVETTVNRVIWENRPITTRILPQDAIDRTTLRKPPAVTGNIRVVEVGGYDASACGGTHVAATGEIGIIKITSLERYKHGLRVTFLAGERALHHYQQHLQLLQTSSLALSVGMGELPQAIARLEESVKSTKRELRQLREELLTYQADQLWAGAPVIDGVHVLVKVMERSFAEAQALAGHLRERPTTLILFAVAEQAGTRLVCARSDDLGQFDSAAILRAVLDLLQGRGGGSPTMAQGGAPTHSLETLWRALRQTLAHHNLSLNSHLSHSNDRVD